MATQPIADRFVPVEEYLATSYSPDCEYEDGIVVERNVGEIEHSFLQVLLGTLFTINSEAWRVYGLPEQRVQISAARFFVPDLCVVPLGQWEKIVTTPPLIVLEILSPEDTIRRAEEKAQEYLRFGVQHVWVIDPYARVTYRGTAAELERVPSGELTVPGTPIVVRTAELFEKLDAMRARSER
ncbi:MAG: Uma2 family endonuclease [Acidobacteriota bacterium]